MPAFLSVNAKFAATVDFPTPPFPLAMAIICLIPSKVVAGCCAGDWAASPIVDGAASLFTETLTLVKAFDFSNVWVTSLITAVIFSSC